MRPTVEELAKAVRAEREAEQRFRSTIGVELEGEAESAHRKVKEMVAEILDCPSRVVDWEALEAILCRELWIDSCARTVKGVKAVVAAYEKSKEASDVKGT